MTCLHVPMPNGTIALLSVGEPDRVIRVDGREWRFEWSDRFGPLFLGKHAEIAAARLVRNLAHLGTEPPSDLGIPSVPGILSVTEALRFDPTLPEAP